MSAILIVEDEPFIRELADVILSQAGHDVATASNGEVALMMLRQQRFDLVLLDVQMPVMSGLEVLKAMKRMGPAAPPALMVTANRSVDTVNEAMALGCIGYVAKPYTPEGLTSLVNKVLAERGTSSSAQGRVWES